MNNICDFQKENLTRLILAGKTEALHALEDCGW